MSSIRLLVPALSVSALLAALCVGGASPAHAHADEVLRVMHAHNGVMAARRARPLWCSRQRGSSLRLCSARTDNYKDCYNTPDGVYELRTWLALRKVIARGAHYRAIRGDQFSASIAVQRIRGNPRMPARGWITVVPRSRNIRLVNFRSGPPAHLWGPLLQLKSRAALRKRVVRVEVRLHAPDGRVRARTLVSYRRDRRIAAVSAGHPEFRGPGGRWYVSGRRTATDVELGARHSC